MMQRKSPFMSAVEWTNSQQTNKLTSKQRNKNKKIQTKTQKYKQIIKKQTKRQKIFRETKIELTK